MRHARRKLGFVLAASGHGPLIVNRFDYHRDGDRLFGVGGEILEWSLFDPDEVELVLSLLQLRRRYFGDGVAMLDCGANIGVHTIECAVEMSGWGSVLAIEAQERLYYALAGNIALNNCFNATAVHAAIAGENGAMRVPVPDYLSPGSFGSVELRARPDAEFIGQKLDYSEARTRQIRCLTLDSIAAGRLDLIKMDIEGMEAEALAGGAQLIATHHPILLVEWLKSDKSQLSRMLECHAYRVFERGRNLLAVHRDDPSLQHIGQPVGTAVATTQA